MIINFPYGEKMLQTDICEDRLNGILLSSIHNYKSEYTQEELVKQSLRNPIDSQPLYLLSRGKRKIVIIASDHTRPVPSKILMPLILGEIRKGNPSADITILIATGCHRETTSSELINKFGHEIYNNEKILIHDCDNSETCMIGVLPSGGECNINKIVIDADLVVSEGFIEPHFFAGFSGARKSILPGVANRSTIMYNHNSDFINSEKARTGLLEENPINLDMIWAANKAKLAYIVNVIINSKKEIIHCVSGHHEKAHKKGCDFLTDLCKVNPIISDIVISTNGGYPLDQNIYQSVKGMTAAEATVRQDGVIIMLSRSNDGIGGDAFYHQLADEKDINKTMKIFLSRDRYETVPDQWQTQIFLRVLKKATVIFISDVSDKIVRDMHMLPAHSLNEALKLAENILENNKASITAIPDGVSVMVN